MSIKSVILCGGLGTRISEETQVKPKPMVEIGGKPILWHIMKIYHTYNISDFTLALGYKGEVIKDYFINYYQRNSDMTINTSTGKMEYENVTTEDWNVQLIDTGKESMTGGRLYKLRKYLIDDGTFMLTYGDGVANIEISKLIEFHKKHKKIATVTAVRPPARFGAMEFDGDKVVDFHEKPQTGEGWINGGFFVFEPEIFDYLEDEKTILEKEPLEKLAGDNQLMAFKHNGFWHPMDTLRDKNYLHESWKANRAEWKVWE